MLYVVIVTITIRKCDTQNIDNLILAVIMLSAIKLHVLMLSVTFSVCYAECIRKCNTQHKDSQLNNS
jgi:hypothetical protein